MKPTAKKETGTVKWFNDKRGYGFIIRDSKEPDIFVHHTGIKAEGHRTLLEGERVEFEIGSARQGPKAVNVVKI